jgi:hypothetical protein
MRDGDEIMVGENAHLKRTHEETKEGESGEGQLKDDNDPQYSNKYNKYKYDDDNDNISYQSMDGGGEIRRSNGAERSD